MLSSTVSSGESGLHRPSSPTHGRGAHHAVRGDQGTGGGRVLGEEGRCEQGLAMTLSAGTLAYLWVQPTPFVYVRGEGMSI